MKNKNKFKSKKLIILIVVLICIITFSFTFARFLSTEIGNFFIKSKEFYFYADKLSENTSVFQIDNWSGVDSYTITINMNSRKNNIEVATYDIGYTVSYTSSDNVICQLNKNSGTILANSNSDSFNLVLTPNRQLDTGDRVIVEIQVASTSPYQKTLKGRFTLVVGKENLSYEVKDESKKAYLDLSFTNTLTYYTAEQSFGTYTVGDKIDMDTYLALSDSDKNKFYSSKVNVSFDPSVVLLDMTNKHYNDFTNITSTQINGKTYITGFTFKIDAISSLDIKFYKVNSLMDYTYPITNNTCIFTITSI